MNAIEIRGLEKRFESFELGPLDLTVPLGSIYGFVGPNGAGKSTTIDLLFGMGIQDAGSLHLLGLDLTEHEVAIKRRVAYVSPELEYSAWGSVDRVIRFVKGFYPESWDDDHCLQLLERFGLDVKEKVASLSSGSRMKLALILVLARRPEVLVLDEPTTGLDTIAKQELYSQLLTLVGDEQHSVLLSSHSLQDMERFADRLGIIHEGKLIHEGPTDAIVGRYCTVDFDFSGEFGELAGFTLTGGEENRRRGLLDRETASVDKLAQLGATEIQESPVTLEDLFVTLMKK